MIDVLADLFCAPRVRDLDVDLCTHPKPHDFLDDHAVARMRCADLLKIVETSIGCSRREDTVIEWIDKRPIFWVVAHFATDPAAFCTKRFLSLSSSQRLT